MPKAYVILTEAIHDPDGMQEYRRLSGPTLAGTGARLLVADGAPAQLEGEWHGSQTVVVEFPSVEAARAWYDSPAYQEAARHRRAAADSNVVIVIGRD